MAFGSEDSRYRVRINYVLPTWSGDRRLHDRRYMADKTFYLRKHLRALGRFDHQLAQITVAVPDNPTEPNNFTALINSLTSIKSTPIVVLRRPNLGLSYGSLSDVYVKYRRDFDYYLFQEDDVCYAQHNFDDKWRSLVEEKPQCGFFCAVISNYLMRHAGVGCGIIRSDALEKVFEKNHRLPYCNDCRNESQYGRNEVDGQIGLSQAIIAEGFELHDLESTYRAGFRRLNMSVDWFYTKNKKVMVAPL